jgi:hypothetical protein
MGARIIASADDELSSVVYRFTCCPEKKGCAD